MEAARAILKAIDPALDSVSDVELARLLEELARDTVTPPLKRWQDEIIEKLIAPGASVLDLGCGGGELLARLMQTRQVRGQGVEIDAEMVIECVERGVPVVQANLDEGLQGFGEASFDYVVLEETLQTLRRPVDVLREVLRVGRLGVVSFPNFGHWKVRFSLAVKGRMPVTEALPYQWFDSPNIRTLTLVDFWDWAKANGVNVREGWGLMEGRVEKLRNEGKENLYVEEALLLVEKS